MAPTETWTRTHLDWADTYARHGQQLRRIDEHLARFEEEGSILLSQAAVEVLLLPLVEELDRGVPIDENQLFATLDRLMRTIAEDPDPRDLGTARSSWSVLRAIRRLWCDLPPICRPAS